MKSPIYYFTVILVLIQCHGFCQVTSSLPKKWSVDKAVPLPSPGIAEKFHPASLLDWGSSSFTQLLKNTSNCVDQEEPNNEVETATSITGVIYINDSLCLTSGDEDWFSVNLLGESYYLVIKSFSESRGRYGLKVIFDGDILEVETYSVSLFDVDTYIELLNGDLDIIQSDSYGGEFPFSQFKFSINPPDFESMGYLSKDSLNLSGEIFIWNEGLGPPIDSSNVRFYLSSDDNNEQDILLINFPILNPGDSVRIPFEIDLLSSCGINPCVGPGRYILNYEIDSHRTSGEENRSNNYKWWPTIPIILTAEDVGYCFDEYEPNNFPDSAFILREDLNFKDTLCFYPGDSDWFTFEYGAKKYYIEINCVDFANGGEYLLSIQLNDNHLNVSYQDLTVEANATIRLNNIIFGNSLNTIAIEENSLNYILPKEDTLNLDIIYVDSSTVESGIEHNGSSWSTAFYNLQDALEVADSRDQIWIAKGTYFPTQCNSCSAEDRSKFFQIPDTVSLFGGFSGTETSLSDRKTDTVSLFLQNPTRISGNIGLENSRTDNSFKLLELSGPSNFSGLIFSGGYVDPNNSNTAVINYVYESIFELCVFTENYLGDKSGELINIDSYSLADVSFVSCTFLNNKGGKIIPVIGATLSLNNCGFYNNESTIIECEGDVDGGSSYLQIEDSRFYNNHRVMHGIGSTIMQIQRSDFCQNDSIVFDLTHTELVDFTDCKFIENNGNSILYQGELFLRDLGEDLLFNNCEFFGNKTGGYSVKAADVRLVVQNTSFIDGSGALELENVRSTISNCLFEKDSLIAFNQYGRSGSGIYGAAIRSRNGEAQITNSRFSENFTLGDYVRVLGADSWDGGGGAIYLEGGKHSITNCQFDKNSQLGKGGGAILCEEADLIIKKSEFLLNENFDNNNLIGEGGALSMLNGNLTIDSCIFRNNHSLEGRELLGGGIRYINDGVNSLEELSVSNTIFWGNNWGIQSRGNCSINQSYFSEENGTGINHVGVLNIENSTIEVKGIDRGKAIHFQGRMGLSNSTISVNTSLPIGAIGTTGFSFPNLSEFNENFLQIKNSSIIGNSLESTDAYINLQENDTCIIKSSILSNRTGSLFSSEGGNVISLGYNLISDSTSSKIKSHPTDLIGNNSNPIKPLVGPLEDNGGATFTHALLTGSPAIGSGEPLSSFEVVIDQRGYSRIIGNRNGQVDIGAYEYQETHIEAPSLQLCQNEKERFSLGTVSVIDSSGGAWEIGDSQLVELAFPTGITIENEPEIFGFGVGVEILNSQVSEKGIQITYNRNYTTTPSGFEIRNLNITANVPPGNYPLLRTNSGDAKQIGNTVSDSLSHADIWVFPSLSSSQLPYDDSFESSISVWQAESDSSLWERGSPIGSTINASSSGEKVWAIDLDTAYTKNIHTWLYSPCFDLTQLRRPILSLDYWSDTEFSLDGAVLQASIDRGENWQSIGSDTSGINWYDTNILLANPGDQPTDQQMGWTGEESGWIKASHRLENSLISPITRFRLAFRSSDFINPVKGLNGFAFDNFFLGERSQRLLLEDFPSEKAKNLIDRLPNLFQAFRQDVIPIVYLEENVNHPDANARKALYGISNSETAVLNGTEIFQPLNSLTYRALDTSSLQRSPFTIQIDSDIEDPLMVNVGITALENWNSPVDIHIALLENGVIQGDDTLDFVLRKFLPNAQGIREGAWEAGEKRSFRETWAETMSPSPALVDNLDSLYAIVFVQDPASKEIYQAAKYGQINPLITSNTETLSSFISVNPNPARRRLEIQGLQERRVHLTLYSLSGKIVWDEQLSRGPQRSVELPNLPAGIYVLKISENEEVLAWRKLVISKP